jgi:hypothetical protein
MSIGEKGRTKMRLLFALLAIALFGVGAVACGSASKGTRSTPRVASDPAANGATTKVASSATLSQSQSPLPTDNDYDNDNPSNSHYDQDDNAVLYFGHATSAAEARAIMALVKRYYAAAVASDGATACSLIYSIVAESVPEGYGQLPALRGKTCAVVVSKLFKKHHRELVAEVAGLEVTHVRVEGDRGLALLRFRTMPERRVLVHREHGVWKMGVLLDIGVP